MARTLTFTFLSLLATSAFAAPAPQDSWGKAGVSLAQYRQDSVECATEGYNLDISQTEDAQVFVRATRELQIVPSGLIIANIGGPLGGAGNSVNVVANWAGVQQHIVDSTRPEERFKNIKQMQLAKTDQCLVSRGYSKFRLTDEQRSRLRKLKFGSDERRAYLYSLASNPAVLQSQSPVAQP